MSADKKSRNLYIAMVELATLIEEAKDRKEADDVFKAIVVETDTMIAEFIWEYYVNWEVVKWKEE